MVSTRLAKGLQVGIQFDCGLDVGFYIGGTGRRRKKTWGW